MDVGARKVGTGREEGRTCRPLQDKIQPPMKSGTVLKSRKPM